MKHINPYTINDPDNWAEVTENSSHPELNDARRVWRFGGYGWNNATDAIKFLEGEGLDPKRYTTKSKKVSEFAKNLIIIEIVPK